MAHVNELMLERVEAMEPKEFGTFLGVQQGLLSILSSRGKEAQLIQLKKILGQMQQSSEKAYDAVAVIDL